MDESFLTVSDVARLLQMNEQTVRNWIDRGELRAVRVGSRRVRVRREDLDAFIEAGSPTLPEGASDEQSEQAASWEAFGTAMTAAVDVLRDRDPKALVAALRSLAVEAENLAALIEQGQRVIRHRPS